MCRAAIDISLLWSERHQQSKIQVTASIVGAWFPRPMGWGTQPLRVQWGVHDNTTLRSSGARGLDVCRAAIDISLLWSERHQHTKIQGAASIVGAWFPRPMGWGTQPLRIQWWGATIPHCAPLERGDWMCRAAIDISLLWSERHQHTKIQGAASIVGAWFPRPTGWGTQPLRVQWWGSVMVF